MLSGYKFIIFIGSCEEDLDSTLFTDASLGLDTGPVAVGTGNDSALDRQAMLSIWGVGVSVPGPLLSEPRGWSCSAIGLPRTRLQVLEVGDGLRASLAPGCA